MTSRPQSYIEGEDPDSQHDKSKRGSKVTTEKVALLVLCFLLAVAFVVTYRLSFEHMRTKEMLKNLEGLKKECEHVKNLSESKPCSQPEVKINQMSYKCEDGWEQDGGKCYYFSIAKSSWNEGRDECRAKKGDLVKINSMEEQEFLESKQKGIKNSDDKFLIELIYSAKNNTWVWRDGSSLNTSLTFWKNKDQDNKNGTKGANPDEQSCLRVEAKGGAKLSSCRMRHRSICEKQTVTERWKYATV